MVWFSGVGGGCAGQCRGAFGLCSRFSLRTHQGQKPKVDQDGLAIRSDEDVFTGSNRRSAIPADRIGCYLDPVSRFATSRRPSRPSRAATSS